MDRLKGKIALITGGTSGIGLATAELFLAEGAQIIVTGRDEQRIEEAKKHLGADALVLNSEAGNLAHITLLMEKIQSIFKKLDIMVLNAAILQSDKFEDIDSDKYDELMNTNSKGPYFTIIKALPLLSNNSSIILITSIAQNKGLPNSNVYAASKAALRSFVRSFAVALIERGIRVNAVSPGPIDTGGFETMKLPVETITAMKNRLPVKRFGSPKEISQVVLFLATDDASYIVGEEISVDGGNACT